MFYLLQKVKRSSDLPVIEKWEAYMLPKHSCFGAITEEHFLEDTRLLPTPKKINRSFLRREFRRDCRRFLRISRAPSSLHLPRVLQLDKDLAFSVLRSSLRVTIILLSTSLDNCWMGCLDLAGLGGPKLKLQRLSSTFSSASSDRWKQVAVVLVCQ